MKNRFCTIFAVAAALAATVAAAAPAQSGVIIDTFRSGNTFDTNAGYLVGDSVVSGLRFDTAAAFTLTADGTVNDVAVAAFADDFTLVIVGDNAGLPDSGVLGTVSSGFTVDGYIEFDPSITLSAGTYWLLMKAPVGVAGSWYNNLDPLMDPLWDPNVAYLEFGPVRQSDSDGADWTWGGPNTFLPAFRVGVADATQVPVPEPGTLALAGAGLLGIAALRRRPRRKG